ncbi:hypothetical protein Clacol_000319 [Clathrus columnatus]|uniref:Cytochrome P450 n=1 Tax=Clathrus columnatus TaxID=1419009 RepID=A0AAV5A2L3_9AGAM|nr:hypothetical protein Clacol_000319 [Clathrus columnatus]
MSFTNVQLLCVSLIAIVVYKLSKKLTAQKPLADVAGPQSEHWLKGNYHRIFQDGFDYNLQLAEKYGGVVKIHALLGDQQLYVSDPLALYHIVVKEQTIYEETDMGNKLIFGEGLVSTLGEQHRHQRKILNPVFSMGNMRELLPVIQPIANKICSIFLSEFPADGGFKEIDIVPWMSRGALEHIGQGALGHSFNALAVTVADKDEYTSAVRNLGYYIFIYLQTKFPKENHFRATVLRLILLRPFIPIVVRNFSLHWRNKIMDWAPIPALRELRRIVNVMDKASKTILEKKRVEAKMGVLDSEKVGKDVMTIMLRDNADSSQSERLTESEILGQMNTFIFAGFETTAIALSRVFFILASRPDVQSRLRAEIRSTKRARMADGDATVWQDVNLPYDVLMTMPYLDAIVRETMRVYPPSSLFGRTLRKATTLPLQYPIRTPSGSERNSIALPANTNIIISILAANHNKKVWGEDASEWKPERWLNSSKDGAATDIDVGDEIMMENKSGVKYPGVYSSMMTFMGGARACIGFKFAEMEIKQVLVTLLSSLHFGLPSTPDAQGNKKEIYWKMNGLQVPVVREPAGDGKTATVPLDVRKVNESDFE